MAITSVFFCKVGLPMQNGRLTIKDGASLDAPSSFIYRSEREKQYRRESQMNYIYQQATNEYNQKWKMVDATQAHQYNYATIQLYPELHYDNNLPEICPLWFDLDCKENPDKARVQTLALLSLLTTTFGLPLDTIQLYFSGNKGFHIIIGHQVLGIQPHISLHRKHKQVASILQNDHHLTTVKSYKEEGYQREDERYS